MAKGCLSCETGVIMVFKMIQTAQSSRRRLDGQNQLPKLITGVKFTDGIEAGQKRRRLINSQPGRHQDSRIARPEETFWPVCRSITEKGRADGV